MYFYRPRFRGTHVEKETHNFMGGTGSSPKVDGGLGLSSTASSWDDTADIAHFSPLRQAVMRGNIQQVRNLLSTGLTDVNLMEKELNKKEELWCSSLETAVRSGNEMIVDNLCGSGADVNGCNSIGATPFHVACQKGNITVVKLLLKRSAAVDAPDRNGRTPLYIATENGHTQVVQLLLQSGADPNAGGTDGISYSKPYYPLHVAAQLGKSDIVNLLCQHIDVDVDPLDVANRTPLMLACQQRNVSVIKSLIRAGAEVNKVDKHGRVPLVNSLVVFRPRESDISRKALQESLKILIESGARFDITDNFGYTAAQYSVMQNRQKESAILFFRHGAPMLTEKLKPDLLEFWQDLSNVELLVQLSPEFRPFACKVLREYSSRLSTDATKSLKAVLSKPPTLKAGCRCVIRAALQNKTDSSIFPLINKLPLPTLCIKYLQYDEMELTFSDSLQMNYPKQ